MGPDPLIGLPNHTLHTTPLIRAVERGVGYSYLLLTPLGTLANLLAVAIFLDFPFCSRRGGPRRGAGPRRLPLSTTLFLHLALADLVTALLVLPSLGYMFLHKDHAWLAQPFAGLCDAQGALFNISSRQSGNIFGLLTAVRCAAVVRPLSHQRRFTKRRVKAVLAGTWCVSVVMSCLVFLVGGRYVYNDTVTLCTFTIDDLGARHVGRAGRSVMFGVVVVLPILLPVVVTVVCLGLLLAFFSKGRASRDRVRVSLADLAEVNEGFAQAMKTMLDSRKHIRNSLSGQRSRAHVEPEEPRARGAEEQWEAEDGEAERGLLLSAEGEQVPGL